MYVYLYVQACRAAYCLRPAHELGSSIQLASPSARFSSFRSAQLASL